MALIGGVIVLHCCACRHVELDSSKSTCYIAKFENVIYSYSLKTKFHTLINVVMLEKHGGHITH